MRGKGGEGEKRGGEGRGGNCRGGEGKYSSPTSSILLLTLAVVKKTEVFSSAVIRLLGVIDKVDSIVLVSI